MRKSFLFSQNFKVTEKHILISLISGYLFGTLLPFFSEEAALCGKDVVLTSLFLSDGYLFPFIRILCREMIFAFPIFLIGFIPYTEMFILPVLFLRAFLASLSSFSLTLCRSSSALTVLHTVCGVFSLSVLWAMARCALNINTKERTDTKSYTLKFLFFSGLVFIMMFIRQTALAFV